MNSELNLLQPYPFEKLSLLLKDVTPADLHPISLSIGEPKHPAPQLVLDAMTDALRTMEKYPGIRGSDELRESIANWLVQRFQLANAATLAADHILPVNGTREGLFAIGQTVLDRHAPNRSVLMPNPFYQIYEGAALLAGCEPKFYAIDEDADSNLASFTDAQLDDTQMIFVCTPGNPTGAVNSQASLQALIEKAHKHDFVIVSDECYSEIYRQSAGAPCGLLQAAYAMGLETYDRCLAFHSLSKRSNLPGLRSGFVAGDATLIKNFAAYRTYQGCAMSGAVQSASVAAWSDEQHVTQNRAAYDDKYAAVVNILKAKLDVSTPPAGFYLWPTLPSDDQAFTQRLLSEQNVRAVPGSFLARSTNSSDHNPGANRLRLALVAPLDDCITAAHRIIQCL
ncbi:succinyldiaminopimelate transaminase [Granulosicoccus sp.]|nr:succinyldiaminopimelate transaminase [Granulosicoccus sp.]MDB4224201.1 succinyldiaminopimelate transaminase [Granulosicoccus sp.]